MQGLSLFEIMLKQRDYSWDQEGWFLPLEPALAGLTAEQAAWRPPGSGNSIWETLNHINYYNGRFVARMHNQPYREIKSNDDSFTLSEEPSEAYWASTLAKTKQIAADVKQVLSDLVQGDPQVSSRMTEPEEQNLIMWITHDAYHTGQIVLLRKQQQSWPATRAYD